MGWTGELWSNCVVLKFKTKGIALFCFLFFSFLFLVFFKEKFPFFDFSRFFENFGFIVIFKSFLDSFFYGFFGGFGDFFIFYFIFVIFFFLAF